jgi:hypothetical protein
MTNEVGIRVTGDDDSGPAFVSAAAKAQKFKTEAKDAGQAARGLGLDLAAAAREADKDASANLRAAMAARQLDREIDEAADSLRKLRIEQALADKGSGDFTERIKQQERVLGDLRNARKTIGHIDAKDFLPDDGELRKEGEHAGSLLGRSTLTGFGSAAKSLGPVASSFAIGIGLQVATVAGPLITASIGGAVLAGAGLGIAGLGALLVKEDARVKSAAGQLGRSVKEAFAEQAGTMIRPVVDSLHELEDEGVKIAPVFGEMFAGVAPHLTGLTRGLTGLVDQLLPGLQDAVQGAGPVIDRLAAELPGLGDAISDTLGSIADAAPGAAEGLGDLIDVMGFFIRSAGFVIETGTNMYSILKGVGTLNFGEVKNAITGTKMEMRELAPATNDVAIATRDAARWAQEFADAARAQRAAVLGSENGMVDFAEAVDRATAAGKANNDGISAGSEKGRANRRILDQLAAATLSYADAIIKETGDQDQATRVTERGRAAFIKSARAMGSSKEAAIELANKLFGLPKKVEPLIALKGDRDANTKIGAVKRELRSVDGIVASPVVNIRINGASRLNKVERQLAGFEHGGLVGASQWDGGRAATGGVRANMTLVGEGGPELVDLPPGSRVTPAAQTRDALAGGGPGAGPIQLIVSARPGANRELIDALVEALRFDIRWSGKADANAYFKKAA